MKSVLRSSLFTEMFKLVSFLAVKKEAASQNVFEKPAVMNSPMGTALLAAVVQSYALSSSSG